MLQFRDVSMLSVDQQFHVCPLQAGWRGSITMTPVWPLRPPVLTVRNFPSHSLHTV